jgi:cell division protein FtsL
MNGHGFDRGVVVIAAALLFAAALSLVTAQHRARSLFIDVERVQNAGKQLDVEFDRLKIDLARLAQPAYVEAEARRLGLKPIDSARTVFIDVPSASAAAPLAPAGKKK